MGIFTTTVRGTDGEIDEEDQNRITCIDSASRPQSL
jgi:hypothetical protein